MFRGIKKKICILFVVLTVALAMTGCSERMDVSINEDMTGSYTASVTMSDTLWKQSGFDEIKDMISGDEAEESGVKTTITDVTEDGVSSKKLETTYSFDSLKDFNEKSGGVMNLVMNGNYASLSMTESFQDSADMELGDLESQLDDDVEPGSDEEKEQQAIKSMIEEIKKMKISITLKLPYTVTKSNGDIQNDGRTVVWSADISKANDSLDNPEIGNLQNINVMYALFNDNTSEIAPTFSGVKAGKIYKSGVSVCVNSENLLEKATLKKSGSSTVKTTDSNIMYIQKTGKYILTAVDINGNTSKISFSIDTRKPTVTGVKTGATYRHARVIKFADKDSGIKKATLNGKKISNKKKVSKKGSYILKVEDKAGNVKIVKFKMK